MKYLQGFTLILFSLFSYFHLFGLEYASSSFSVYENQIFEDSSETKVKKLQEVFKGLWLYDWTIDWDFDSIKQILIDFQLDQWIIYSENDDGAWYFWTVTTKALEDYYWDDFLELKETYLRIDSPSTEEKYFYISAYYSPLPNQSRYATWTYSWDVRLNGWWTITASWKWVFPWLLAWPRNYDYWTRIYFEWIGIWSIEDRWGAIVNAWERGHEYDRIDIWMWYWDDWLQRALKWWKRAVKWKIVEPEREVNIEFDLSPVDNYPNLTVDWENPEKEDVINLQKLFVELEMYNWEINWDFDTVKDILIDFQIDKWIITNKNDEAAWYFWNKTRAALKAEHWEWFFVEKYIKPWDHIAISDSKKKELNEFKEKVDVLLDKKYNWNLVSISKVKDYLKWILETVIESTTSISKKNELRYLQIIL